jgi:mannitol-specific phosphotransferase system IIBC component
MNTFQVRLRQDDWDDERGAWRCEALRAAGLKELLINKQAYAAESDGDFVSCKAGPADARSAVAILSLPEAEKKGSSLGGILAVVVPATVTLVAAYFTYRSEDRKHQADLELERMRSESALEIEKIRAEAAQNLERTKNEAQQKVTQSDKARSDVESANRACVSERDQLKIKLGNICSGSGKGSVNCKDAKIVIGSQTN